MQPQRAIRACRGAGIELFSDRGNHCGAICTPTEFGSQASVCCNMRNITPGVLHESVNCQRVSALKRCHKHPANYLILIGSRPAFRRQLVVISIEWHRECRNPREDRARAVVGEPAHLRSALTPVAEGCPRYGDGVAVLRRRMATAPPFCNGRKLHRTRSSPQRCVQD